MKQQKSRKGIRILKKRTPKGKNVTHYVKKKPKQSTCARCGARLQGVPRASPNELAKMTKSARSVSRKLGGVLCGRCVKESEKYKVRVESGLDIKRDLTIEKYLPKGWFASLKAPEPAKPKAEPKEKPKKAAPKKAAKPKKKVAKKPAAKKKTTKKKKAA